MVRFVPYNVYDGTAFQKKLGVGSSLNIMVNLRVTQGNKEDALTSNYVPFIFAGRFTFKQCFTGCKWHYCNF